MKTTKMPAPVQNEQPTLKIKLTRKELVQEIYAERSVKDAALAKLAETQQRVVTLVAENTTLVEKLRRAIAEIEQRRFREKRLQEDLQTLRTSGDASKEAYENVLRIAFGAVAPMRSSAPFVKPMALDELASLISSGSKGLEKLFEDSAP